MRVHLVGGEKGGIGKSFFVKVLVSYYRRRNKPFNLFEADDVNRDIFETYNRDFPVRQVVFTESERGVRWPNEIVYAAEHGDVIVNLPAAVYRRIAGWYKANRLGDQLGYLGVRLYVWYISDGDSTSLRLFHESCKAIDVPHIFVKNMLRMTAEDWEKQLKSHGVNLSLIPHIVLERLGVEGEIMANQYLSFERFIDQCQRKIERRVVELFLEETVKQVEEAIAKMEAKPDEKPDSSDR